MTGASPSSPRGSATLATSSERDRDTRRSASTARGWPRWGGSGPQIAVEPNPADRPVRNPGLATGNRPESRTRASAGPTCDCQSIAPAFVSFQVIDCRSAATALQHR